MKTASEFTKKILLFNFSVITDSQDALTAANLCLHKHYAFSFIKPWIGDGLLTSAGI